MSDPPRLADPRSKSPAPMRRLIQAGRSDLPDKERLRSLEGRLGFGAGPPAASGAAVKGAAAGMGAGAVKIGAAVVLVLGAGVGALATRNLTKAPPTVVTAPSATSAALPFSSQSHLDREIAAAAPSTAESALPPAWQAPPAESKSGGLGLASVPASSVKAVTSAMPSLGPISTARAGAFETPTITMEGAGSLGPQPERSTADTEFSLLEQAQRALRTDPQRALDLTDRVARESPSGPLAQEREVIAIEALVQVGRTGEARARAGRFFQAFPGSAHGPRVAALLDFDAGVHNP